MCGRFANLVSLQEIKESFEIEQILTENYINSGNIFPNDEIAAIIFDEKRKLIKLKWGFLPSWANDKKFKEQINARAETIKEKAYFKDSFKKRRTLIISSGFYEWKHEGKEKIPVYIRLKNGEPFLLAGIYDFRNNEAGVKIGTTAIITTEANDLMKTIHDRMPVIIKRKDIGLWLDCSNNDNEQLVLPFLTSIESDELELIPGHFKDKIFIPDKP